MKTGFSGSSSCESAASSGLRPVRHDKRRFFPAQLVQIQRRKLLGKLLLLRNLHLRGILGSHGQNVRPIGCFPACLLPLLLAAFLDKNVRAHGLFARLLLRFLAPEAAARPREGSNSRGLCAAAFHLLLNVVDALLRHVVHDPLGGVGMARASARHIRFWGGS